MSVRQPTALNAVVSMQMSRMPRAGTAPEVALRRELHRRGMRFRLHARQLPGRPDIILPSTKIAIFVDGCFWHACPDHGSMPKNNRDWWQAKLRRNVERDREKDTALERLGWLVIHIWEHEGLEAAADVVESTWRGRRAAAERLPDRSMIL